jgi:hypothetical protein
MKAQIKNLRNSAFMVMPFQDPVADDVYRHSTKPIIESCGLKMFRADEIFSANPVFDDIIAALEQSAIGFAVFALNDQVFIPNYKPFDERYKGYKVANEE